MLNQSSGTAATLTFTPNGPTNVNPPSNVNYGVIQLACPGCTTLSGGVGAFFDPFTLDVEVMVGGNSGTFTATSTGGWVYLNQSTISLHWEPSQLGPGTFNLDQGTFGPIFFGNPTLTGVVAPNSGAIPGLSTVQGPVGSVNVPESSSKVEWSVAIATLAFFSRRMMRRQVN
ncbi:hypothetical protein F183_A04300 [Bryobacterales bacterium F-183]|nr:hypothetical protein F183_A04300 [Bryobacterales bacterium F-183]